MVQGMKESMRLLVAAVAVLGAGCGDGNFKTESDPRINVEVNSLPISPGKCSEFLADQTRGQLSYEKKILITNATPDIDTPPVLCLKSVKFVTTNKQLKMTPTGALLKDEATCPGAMAALPLGKSLTLRIDWNPDRNEIDNSGGTVVIESNDPDRPKIELCIGIASAGATIKPCQKKLTFNNASAANPPTTCACFENDGAAPLVFDSAWIDPAVANYQIVKQPNQGDVIPAKGDTGNPVGSPKQLEVCVRFTPPAAPVGNYPATVVIKTNDKASPQTGVALEATWDEDNKFTVTCSSATGQMEFNFQGVTVGQKIAKCKIYNDGPAVFLVNKPPVVKAVVPGVSDADLAAAYVAHLETATGTVVSTPYGVAKAKAIDVVVTFTAPVSGAAPQARLEIAFSQANKPGALLIPIIVGSCDTPAPDFGQRPELWLQAGMGGSAKAKVVVANQSCAPLQVLDACVTSAAGVVGAEPCKKGASQYFKLAQPFAATSVPAWGLLPIEVELAPQNDLKTTVNDLLHVAYCAGTWANNQCDGGSIVYQALNLNGSLKTEVQLPEFKLLPVTGAVVGQQLKLEGAFTQGTHPNGKNYAWVIVGRPEGSHVWLPEAYQTTGEPFLTFTPDVAGKYTVAAMAQAIEEGGSGDYTWSPQSTIEIDVGPKP